MLIVIFFISKKSLHRIKKRKKTKRSEKNKDTGKNGEEEIKAEKPVVGAIGLSVSGCNQETKPDK